MRPTAGGRRGLGQLCRLPAPQETLSKAIEPLQGIHGAAFIIPPLTLPLRLKMISWFFLIRFGPAIISSRKRKHKKRG